MADNRFFKKVENLTEHPLWSQYIALGCSTNAQSTMVEDLESRYIPPPYFLT